MHAWWLQKSATACIQTPTDSRDPAVTHRPAVSQHVPAASHTPSVAPVRSVSVDVPLAHVCKGPSPLASTPPFSSGKWKYDLSGPMRSVNENAVEPYASVSVT